MQGGQRLADNEPDGPHRLRSPSACIVPSRMSIVGSVASRRRRRGVATRMAAVVALVLALLFGSVTAPSSSPWAATARAAGTCTGWASDTVPPTTIRVLRTTGPASGSVQVVPFHDYVTVVMAAEWGAGNPAEVLKAGAVAVKEYAWYQAMFWRGGSAADGSCYDVVDSSVDQVYSPETRVPAASLTAAVDATWGITVRRNTGIFSTHYRAGADVGCGMNADGTNLYQLSATHCAQDGMTFDVILTTYYGPGVVVAGVASGIASPVSLQFRAQPAEGIAGVPFTVQPVVGAVDATGQLVTGDTAGPMIVSLGLASPAPGVALTCTGGPTRTTVAGVATFAGCMLTGPASGVVLVATAAGLASASTPPFAVVAAAPSLTLTSSGAAITWGQDVQFAARLVPPGQEPAAGRTLRLERSSDGIAWAPAAQLVTDATGSTSAVDRPTTNTSYRLAFDASPDMSAAVSPVVRVLVRRQVQLRPDNGSVIRPVRRGAAVTFSATANPAPGATASATTAGPVQYRLYQLVGRAWVTKRTWNVAPGAAGVARLRIVFASRGTWSVRAFALATLSNAISTLSPAQRYAVR